MRELLRSSEGTVSRSEFRKGAAFLIALTGISALLLAGIFRLSHQMEWMTVMIAPFFGMVVFFVVCSLLYFWFCLFIKRLRAMGQPLALPYAWLGVIAISAIGYLMDYQNKTLGLSDVGPLVYSGALGTLFGFLALLFFVIQLGVCWFGPDRNVGAGQCFPVREDITGKK